MKYFAIMCVCICVLFVCPSTLYTHIHVHRLLYFDAFFDAFFFSDGSNSEVEKAPFIAKPVRLTPAWEANNLPNDELNFRGIETFIVSVWFSLTTSHLI